MLTLAESGDPHTWQEAFDGYISAIQKHASSAKRRGKLIELDRFVREQLPDVIKRRWSEDEGTAETPYGHLSKDELCKVVEWKITVSRRGTCRVSWLVRVRSRTEGGERPAF